MKKTIKIIDLYNMISKGSIPKKIKYNTKIYEYDKDQDDYSTFVISHYEYLLDDINITSQLNDEVEILDEEDEIEIPQEFLKDVNTESEIVLIKDNLGHDKGYENSIGFITDKNCLEGYYVFAFDKRANRWLECGFDKDEYIRTGLFVSDLIYKPFKAEPIEEEFEYIQGLENEKEFYCYTEYEKYKNDIDKILYILKAINITEEKIDNLNNQINQLIKNQKKIIERLK